MHYIYVSKNKVIIFLFVEPYNIEKLTFQNYYTCVEDVRALLMLEYYNWRRKAFPNMAVDKEVQEYEI